MAAEHPYRTIRPDGLVAGYYNSVAEALEMIEIQYHDEMPKPEIQRRIGDSDKFENISWFIYQKIPSTGQWEDVHGPFGSRAAADEALCEYQKTSSDEMEVRPLKLRARETARDMKADMYGENGNG